jgi:hypothetical protein
VAGVASGPIFSALMTNSVRRCVAIAQPTMRRDQTSSTTARHRKPDRVGMWVMTATHRRSSPAAANYHSTKPTARPAVGSAMVVRTKRSKVTPHKSAARINRATRVRPTCMP